VLEKTKISVVIPFYNAEKTLKLCLNAVCDQATTPDEIILVDNNSNDNSRKIADSFIEEFGQSKITYAFCEKPGPSAARNKGANIATGGWLFFTDSDCLPSSTWISDYIRHFGDEEIGAVAGCIKPYSPSNVVQKTLSLFTLPENQEEIIRDHFSIVEGLYPAANLAVKRDIFSLVGGFNESLMYGEDHELCYKIYESGCKIKVVKDAVVEHIHRKSLGAFLKQSFWFGTAHPYDLRYLSQGRIIFMSPFLNINKVKAGRYIWIDLNQADKKLLGVIILGLLWWPFYSLALIYFLYLCSFIYKKAWEKNIKANIIELPPLAFLLFLKSAALTMGRIIGSFRNRVLCF
jgi:glycosyltransferase involved in cell wall biosynthesis